MPLSPDTPRRLHRRGLVFVWVDSKVSVETSFSLTVCIVHTTHALSEHVRISSIVRKRSDP
jgi:hypothetical protein